MAEANEARHRKSKARGKTGRPASTPSLLTVLAGKRVILCLGSGGVGKTTTAAALAFALAAEGQRVVVLTIDPARRLAEALGLFGSIGNEAVQLPTARKGEVWAAMLDPAETFRHIIRSEAEDEAQAERVLTNRLFKNLTSSLSGTNEYMAAERLLQLYNDERFDRIVVDTPPSRHAIDFLDSPGRLARFVDHRLYRSVFAPKHSLLRPLHAGSQIVMRLLGRLVGSTLVDEVVTFFSDLEGMDQGFRRRANEIEAVLRGPNAGYVLVAAPRHDRLAEAEWIAGNLGKREIDLAAVVVNRVLPLDVPQAQQAVEELDTAADQPLRQNLVELLALANQEAALIDRLRLLDGRAATVFTVAEQSGPITNAADLNRLSKLIVRRVWDDSNPRQT